MEDKSYKVQEYGGWREDVTTFEKLGMVTLASDDRSRSYETDIISIFSKPDGKVAIGTASGCSCWEGDWYVRDFDSLDAIIEEHSKKDLFDMYNPSEKTLAELVVEAKRVQEKNANTNS